MSSFGVTPGFIYETMGGLPAYGAVLIPGSGKQIYDELVHFNDSVGFGCMLVDTPSEDNRVMLDDSGETVLQYALSDADKEQVPDRRCHWHPHDVPRRRKEGHHPNQ